ncbi:2,3,4,5-tetrahydropyridine-2,6-dicarboxylate N-succinyltransferase [Candidatus Erwinia haradaeae]|uniref:2,3,4,5-tetrahydropyridine-2,6-dicarboxylate N-succinyltransferase n=1 Tax=Candidatus Erwinia haradaeae TaxID=1922217 RepID=A0A451D3V8_9GAMM|nr:2,3,4,5-tetrahydropyridine-2,6-dicarboxylate N-succinyltransferase [Candidatus Erwinia haradaeae]VFP80338.1 2,3,4,5-tetrahydropyridine-2,6-dicarboxylate N-succinyltransferase [Candidatus Erwinia haradaeae]
MKQLEKIINDSFDNLCITNTKIADPSTCEAVYDVIAHLDNGSLRVTEKIKSQWIIHEWVKKAILLFFYIKKNQIMGSLDNPGYDKIPMKFARYDANCFKKKGLRVVPPASVRYGAYVARNTVLMPSYVNIGAYIDEGTLIDTWATVGSCAQIGKNVHLSGGVGIGGVLEPLQKKPTIIEDNCFIGARSEIVEGVIVEAGSVISMGVYIGQSTKIYARDTDQIYYGRVPAGSVVVPGSLPSKNKKYNLYCAVIVKTVDAKTLLKTNINQLLRNSK